MSVVVHCHEPGALPVQASLEVEIGEPIRVYLLEREVERASTLRATILRRADALAPPGAELLLEADVAEVGRQRALRVTRVGATSVDHVRAEGRGRVVVGTELRNGARLEVNDRERESVTFSLGFQVQGAAAAQRLVGGGGTRSSRAAAAQSTLLWVVPSALQIIRDPLDDVKDGAVEWLGKSGISPRTFGAILVVGLGLIGSGAFGVTQYFAAQEAKAELAEVTADAEAADAERKAALDGEATCLVDRRALAQKANDTDAAERAAIEAAFGRTLATSLAAGAGGGRYAIPELAAFDKQLWEDDLKAIQAELPAARETVEGTARCRAFTSALDRDLPAHVLLIHPDPQRACPVSYVGILGSTNLRGSWGLSDRAVAELGPQLAVPASDAPGFDLRDVDRHSAALVVAGVRSVRGELLSGVDTVRPVAAPSELNLWSVALFVAANHLPPVRPGAPFASLADCVGVVVAERAAASKTASPGEPILPSVASVAAGKVVFAPAPTAACTWSEGAIATGAKVALRSVARAAVVPAPAPSEAP